MMMMMTTEEPEPEPELGSAVRAVRSSRVLLGGVLRPALISIRDGKIHGVQEEEEEEEDASSSCEVWDVGDRVVMPGVVDSHVHVNEPGRTSIPPTTTLGNLDEKMCVAEGQCFVDTAFWGGVIPGNQFHAEKEVLEMVEERGDPCEYSTFLRSRKDVMEVEAIRTVTQLCLQYRVRCHIVHLSSAEPLALIREAR
ncbi:hypothetical protein CRUP_002218, partial [Coryphaenoides rupestris]